MKRNVIAGMKRFVMAAFAAVALGSCTTLGPGYEQPTVTLASFKALPSEGAIPAFEIGLRVINPNPSALNLVGIVYTVSLGGYEVVKGVGKDFPVIEGYTQQLLVVTASPNLISGIRFLGSMMGREDDLLEYAFEAKLDLGGLYPSLHVDEVGQFSLSGLTQAPQNVQAAPGDT